MFMGIDMPRVMSGTFSQARINAALSADSAAKGASAVASCGHLRRLEQRPRRG